MPTSGLTRRRVLLSAAAGASAVLAPSRTLRAAPKPLTVVLESEVVILDPHATTAAITRTFGYHIFDTLFSMDGKGDIHPQMVREYSTDTNGLVWSFVLRDGLR